MRKSFKWFFFYGVMIYFILSLLPFLMLVYFLVFKKIKVFKVIFLMYVFTFFLLFFVWKVSFITLVALSIAGAIKSFEVYLIIFSVILLFNLLKSHGKIEIIKEYLRSISDDVNVQIVLIGWFMVSFFEGIAGFGTPAAIAAPLLIFLGIRPMTAVIITLVADSVSVAFGAFGTPVIMGIQRTVENANIPLITKYIGFINSFISIFMPLLLLVIFYKVERKDMKELKKYARFAITAGFSFAVPYLICSFIAPEIPSVVASVVGLLVSLTLLRFGIFVKRHNHRLNVDIVSGFLPYLFLVATIFLVKFNLLGLKDWLVRNSLTFNLFGVLRESVSLYNPGLLILFTYLVFSILYKTSFKRNVNNFKHTLSKTSYALITLMFTLAFVKILVNSGMNSIGVESVPILIASSFQSLGLFYMIVSPFLGAFGAFLSGSATVSNMIFSPLQVSAASINNLPISLVLALQTVGAGAGNMIAIHNIIAVSAVVGLSEKEAFIIRKNVVVTSLYCLVAALIAIGIFMM